MACNPQVVFFNTTSILPSPDFKIESLDYLTDVIESPLPEISVVTTPGSTNQGTAEVIGTDFIFGPVTRVVASLRFLNTRRGDRFFLKATNSNGCSNFYGVFIVE